jgi:hypothetical protein
MSNGYGKRDLERIGRRIQVSADGLPDWKTGGITVEWGLVPAVSGADVVVPDEGTTIKIGEKYLPWGLVLCEIGANSSYSLAVTATGGTMTFGVSVDGEAAEDTAAVAFNANAAAQLAAIQALANVGAGDITVTGTGPFVHTFGGDLAGHVVVITVNAGSLTGGSAVFTPVSQGSLSPAKYGPYSASAIDGRQNLVRDKCFILNELVLESERRSEYPPVFDGGRVFKDRITYVSGNLPGLHFRLPCLGFRA